MGFVGKIYSEKEGLCFVRITINRDLKIVQFWCESDYRENIEVQEMIIKIFEAFFSNEKYKKIIYISGKEKLYDTVEALLKNNL